MTTIAKRDLGKLTTVDLIAQYERAISSHSGRYTEKAPRQQRINLIVGMLSDRADAGDAAALEWLA